MPDGASSFPIDADGGLATDLAVGPFQDRLCDWFPISLSRAELAVAGGLVNEAAPDAPAASPLPEQQESAGLAQLRARDFQGAIATEEGLVQHEPRRALHHLRLGFAFHGCERLDEAERCYRRAIELDRRELDPRLALVDLLLDRGEPAEALAALEEASGLAPGGAAEPGIVRRRLEVLLSSNQHQRAWDELGALKRRPGRQEDEARRALATALTDVLPAKLLCRGLAAEANALLLRCGWLGASRRRLHRSGHLVDRSELPRSARAWLGERVPRRPVERGDLVVPAISALFAALLVATALMVSSAGQDGPDDAYLWKAVLFGAAALAVVFAVRSTRALVVGRLGEFRVFHPLYFVEGRPGALLFWPWVNLRRARFARCRDEGSRLTIAHLEFADTGEGAPPVSVLLDEQQEALASALAVPGALRRWALGRLALGTLEQAEAATAFPPELLRPRPTGPFLFVPLSGRTVLQYLGALAAALLLVPVAVQHNRAVYEARTREAQAQAEAADEAAFAELQAHPSVATYRAYMARAEPAHGEEARVIWEQVKAELGNRMAERPSRVTRGRLAQLLDALASDPDVCLQLGWGRPAEAGSGPDRVALEAFGRAAAESAVPTRALQSAFDVTFGEGVASVSSCDRDGALRVFVDMQPGATGQYHAADRADELRFAALAVAWTLKVRPPRSGGPLFDSGGTAAPPQALPIRLGTNAHRETSRREGQEALAEVALWAVMRDVALELGLDQPRPFEERSTAVDVTVLRLWPTDRK